MRTNPKRKSVTAASVRAQLRSALRERLPLLRQLAAGEIPGTTERERAKATALIRRLEAFHGDDFANWAGG